MSELFALALILSLLSLSPLSLLFSKRTPLISPLSPLRHRPLALGPSLPPSGLVSLSGSLLSGRERRCSLRLSARTERALSPEVFDLCALDASQPGKNSSPPLSPAPSLPLPLLPPSLSLSLSLPPPSLSLSL